MKRKKYANKIWISLLAMLMVFTSAVMPLGDSAHSTAFATEMETETVQLSLKLAPETNQIDDVVVLSVNIDKMPEHGLSGISIRLNYPKDEFKLEKYEVTDNLLENDDKQNPPGTSENLQVCPYYMSFGNMNKEAKGLSHKVGELVRFTFKPKTKLEAEQVYNFSLGEIVPCTFLESGDGENAIEVPLTATGTTSCSYTPIAGKGSVVEGSGTVKVDTTGSTSANPAIVKTETINEAIGNENTTNSISLDLSSESASAENGAEAYVALSKTGAAEIAKRNKSLEIKTDAGELKFNQEATANIGKKDGGEKLVISVVKDTTIQATDGAKKAVGFEVTANLVDNNGNATPVTSFDNGDGGEVEVALDLPNDLKNIANLICWNYTDRNYVVVKDGRVENEKYVFKTPHFSKYIVATQETLETFKNEKNLSEGVKVSGQIKSWNNSKDFLIKFYDANAVGLTDAQIRENMRNSNYENTLSLVASTTDPTASDKQWVSDVTVEGVGSGNYKMAIYKPGKYVVKVVPFTVESSEVRLGELKMWLLGDVTYDGNVNGTDAVQIQRYFANLKPNIFTRGSETEQEERLIAANVTNPKNGDSVINGTDAVQIQRYFANLKPNVFNSLT